MHSRDTSSRADLEGGFWGCNPPNGLGHSIKCSTTDVPSHVNALIYMAKCLVVVVVKFTIQTSCGVARDFALVGVPARAEFYAASGNENGCGLN